MRWECSVGRNSSKVGKRKDGGDERKRDMEGREENEQTKVETNRWWQPREMQRLKLWVFFSWASASLSDPDRARETGSENSPPLETQKIYPLTHLAWIQLVYQCSVSNIVLSPLSETDDGHVVADHGDDNDEDDDSNYGDQGSVAQSVADLHELLISQAGIFQSIMPNSCTFLCCV